MDYFVKCEAAILNGGRQPKNLATRLLLCGDVTLATRAQYVVANNDHRFAGSEHTVTEEYAGILVCETDTAESSTACVWGTDFIELAQRWRPVQYNPAAAGIPKRSA